MSKLNLYNLLLCDSPPPPSVVYEELTKVFSFVESATTNDPFFNMEFICSDDDEQVKLVVKYGYRVRSGRWPDLTERWFYDIISAKDFEDE